MRPEGIDEGAWDDACEAMNRVGWHMTSVRIACAQAIMAAKAEERDACAALVEGADSWTGRFELADAIRKRGEV